MKIIAKFHDPLGLVLAIVLQSKLIYQSLCKEKRNWETIVPESIRNGWDKFVEALRNSEKILISRSLFSIYVKSCFYEVHGFADASSEIYSSAIYLRCILGNSNLTALLCSKSRLAPSKITTIPGLELSACVLLSEHIISVILALSKQISIKNVYCSSDSLIALWSIKQNHKTWKLWIQNRLKKNTENVNTEHWNYVTSENNPVDVAARGTSLNSLLKNLLWWNPSRYFNVGSTLFQRCGSTLK